MEDSNRDKELGSNETDVVYETEDQLVVEWPNGDVNVLPRTRRNVLLAKHGMYDLLDGSGGIKFTAGEMWAEIKRFLGRYSITINTGIRSESYVVPDDEELDVLEAVYDVVENGEDDDLFKVNRIIQLYDDLMDGKVRRSVVGAFLSELPSDRVEETDQGWVIDDTFLVNWDAENYTVSGTDQTFLVRGRNEVVETDEEHQAVTFEPSVPIEPREIELPDGSATVNLTEDEVMFLATVDALVNPENHFDPKIVEQIRGVVDDDGDHTIEPVSDVTESFTITAFRDDKSGIVHRHKWVKHTAREAFRLTDRAVDMLYFNDNDHAAVHELAARENELRNAPFNVFADVDNDNEERWREIRGYYDEVEGVRQTGVVDDAPIKEEHHQQIEEMFGSPDDE